MKIRKDIDIYRKLVAKIVNYKGTYDFMKCIYQEIIPNANCWKETFYAEKPLMFHIADSK